MRKIIYFIIIITISNYSFSQEHIASKIVLHSSVDQKSIKNLVTNQLPKPNITDYLVSIDIVWEGGVIKTYEVFFGDYKTIENPASNKKESFLSLEIKGVDYYAIQTIYISKSFDKICFSRFYGQDKVFYSFSESSIVSENYNFLNVPYIKKSIPLSLTDEQKSKSFFEKGDAFFIEEKYSDAIENYNDAIENCPKYYAVYLQLAKSYYAVNKNSECMQVLSDAIKNEPKNPGAYYVRGQIKMALKDYVGALNDFNKVLTIKPDYYGALIDRGRLKTLTKDYNGALLDFNKILTTEADGQAYCYRGIVKNQMKNTKGACLDFSKAGEAGFEKAYDLIKEYCK